MERLFTPVERLLATNDCVVIPEFGGFVLHPCPALYIADEHKFIPPYKGIGFNPTLNHHNRLFWESYTQLYGMTLKEAQLSLKQDLDELYKMVAREGEVYIENIGYLRNGADGALAFEPDRDSSFFGLKPYGLYSFHLPPLVGVKRQVQPIVEATPPQRIQPDQVVYLPVNRTLIRAVSTAAAAVALFFIVSTPLNKVYRSSYTASLITSEMIEQPEPATETTPEMEMDKTAEPVSLVTITEPAITPAPQPVQATATATVTQKTYYAIIGSFATENQANQYIASLNMPELTKVGIVKNEERVRVYADKFDTKEEAQNYILRLRANAKLKDTWLYIQ